jgi:hypothetical protein
MAYDAARSQVVLFGGVDATTRLADTWVWNGTAWADVTPASSPPARSDHALAYDSGRARVVLFGGGGASTYTQDTWEWNGSAWTNVTPATSPPARNGHALAYDAARARTVLFGGQMISGLYHRDTWTWNGASWTDVTPAGANPYARYTHRMAYDSGRGRVVLFGGYARSPTGVVLGAVQDTWEWNGSAWTEMTPGGFSPIARSRHAMTFDAGRGATVVFGGSAGETLQDTWAWTASAATEPALQFEASTLLARVALSAVTGLRVRAFAGGAYAPGGAADVGATLFGWTTHDPVLGPGAWLELASNASGVAAAQPYLGAPATTLIDWRAPSAAVARRFLVERDALIGLQLRPSGPMGPDPGGSRVALDYVEARVRYVNP